MTAGLTKASRVSLHSYIITTTTYVEKSEALQRPILNRDEGYKLSAVYNEGRTIIRKAPETQTLTRDLSLLWLINKEQNERPSV